MLCVDWDLEAPGLHQYFTAAADGPGVVELIHAFANGESPDWDGAEISVEETAGGGSLSLVPAGRLDDGYPERVQRLDWEALYREDDLGSHLEDVRDRWAERYDFVLLDSRTGVTDIGGICTAQLPDLLALCFVANRQSLDGAADVARRASIARNALPYERFRVLTLPLLARLDSREEYHLAARWQASAAEAMQEFYDQWVPTGVGALSLIEQTTVPHVPVWSFGEEIPARTERGSNPQLVTYTFETIAALVARHLTNADELVRSRDEYVRVARQGYDPARPEPPSDPPAWSDDVRIAMWGPPRSGKTTLLNSLALAMRAEPGGSITAVDESALDFIVSAERDLAGARQFPAATAVSSRVRLQVDRSIPDPTWLDRLLRRPPRRRRPVQFRIDVLDPPGEAFLVAGSAQTEVLNSLVEADGLLLTIDPVGGNAGYEEFLPRLKLMMGERGRLIEGRLPYYVAVCVTKFDEPLVAAEAVQRGLAERGEIVPDQLAERYMESAGLIPYALKSYFLPDRIRYFVTSAVGGGNTGSGQPRNVVEPFFWLAQQTRRSQP
ncbi:hypothetical protein Ate02nite_56890 [Paractinoplanes tereljensis]|uniref:Uncharacterized protein n=1 Tax=Paractinoplanes tereljensis TaxID=571912 RepID=A0A919NQ15_9ACTN|nr:hypothetical protein Ate02nite_56890 [Actinoplanes tereljensis]